MRAPTVEDLDRLGSYSRLEVPKKYEDRNGHVNVTGHYELMIRGCSAAFQRELQVDEARAARGEGSFTLTQQLNFHHEILIGEEVSVHWRVLDRSSKVFHSLMILLNRTTGRVASTCEAIEAYVDLRTRRVIEFPQDVADNIDRLIEMQAGLDWELPLSEKLEIRR